MFLIIKKILHLKNPCFVNSPFLHLQRSFSTTFPLTSVETINEVFQSLIYKPFVKSSELDQLLDVCLFFSKIKQSPELSNQDHQKILVSFSQFLQNKDVSFPLILKFMKYTETYNLSNRINSSEILRNIKSRKHLFEEQKHLPEILNFFTQTNVPRFEMNQLLDEIVPIYDKELVEITDSVLISIFYHVVFLNWKYDKKPDLNEEEIGGNIEENMRKSRDNIDFLEACEIELEHRLIKMKTKDFIEFSRILTLNQTRKYQNFELFSSYLELFLEKINKLKEDELISIVKNLRFFKDFPDNFFEKFEREIQKTQISEYKNPRNLFLLLIFIHNSSMKLRSNLIQNLLLSINKNSMKSVTNSTYKSLLEFGKNRDKMSLIFNDLIFLVAFEVEESEFLENSDFPKEILKVYQEKILKKEKTKHFDKQKLIANIKEINNIHDFMKILAISNQINLKDLGVLNSLFEVFKKILKYIEINITQFGEILRVFQELNYYIDPSKNPEIFSVFFETINKKTHNFKVFEIYQLIKVLSVYIRLELDKDSVISRKFIETFQFISEKCIKDRVFFIFNERVELLKFLSFSKETCKSPLVQYLFSYFSFGSNHYFITEQENLMKNDFLNRIVERIMNMRADIEKLPIDLQNLLKKTQKFGGKEVISDNFNENASMNWLKSEVIQYLGLLGLIADDKFVIEENVKEFSYDFDVKLKSQIAGKNDIYLDFLSRDYHCHVNFKSQATAFIIAKIDYLKTVKKVHYNYISDFEWETLDKKDLLSEKLSPFLY